LLGVILSLLALAAALWLCFGLADSFAAFESTARLQITRILVAGCALAGLTAALLALRVSATTAAARADQVLADPRQPAKASLSLDPESAPTPLARYLVDRARSASLTQLESIPTRKLIPWRIIAIPSFTLLVFAAIAAGIYFAAPGPFATVSSRLLHPSQDLPPHSPFKFKITPENPATTYGGEILLTATITGGTPTQAVECLIRNPRSSEILRLPAYRESPTRFSRKLDGLTEPILVAFAIGKARSTWQPVELLLQPNILSGLVRISPPEYTGLAPAEFPLDTNEISAVEGSTITLELTSNRPLGSGTLVFTPHPIPGAETPPITTEATLPASSTAAFTWTSTRSGRIAATLRDVRGTPTAQPLDLAFRALPDMPPSVGLHSPPPLMLATPRAIIPISGRAEDDFALSKVRFLRTLAGFRDRAQVIAPSLQEKSFEFTEKLDLDELGLEAGQTIEISMEASDHNPSLLGQGSSEISRIQIISEDQYAAYIRSKTTLEHFSTRFRAAREALDAAREALEELDQAAADQKQKADPKALADAVERAAEAQKKAAELLGKIAGDFPAFELEKRLQDLAAEQAEELKNNAEDLENLELDPPPDIDELREKIAEMLERLGQQEQQEQQLNQDLAQVEQAGQILEMAAKFRQIYEAQVSIAKRFGTIVGELRQGEDRNRRLLPSLGETQEKNRQSLDEFKAELRRRLDALPEDAHENLAPLIDSANQFLLELENAAPETLMDAAAANGRAGQAGDAFTNAERARALLERLLSEPEPFPQAAQGQAPQFNVPNPDLNDTLQQLLEGLLNQNRGQGNGNQPGGQGGGPGGLGGQGNPGDGFPMDLPVVGPDRMQFDPSAANAGGKSGGDGPGTAAPPLPESAETSILPTDPTRSGQATLPSPESIPEPYRDAVKKFLTP
jgi:hypothetical protein